MSGDRGWGWLSNAKKWHYFVDGVSLCRKWMRLGGQPLEDSDHSSPDNCAACRTRVLAQLTADPTHDQ